ncbi:hypothetical protein SELSPUOL_01996 [Selenomonas sputigena ATCC 35185]|uniref:Uncharacterized protein n=1 Tax=Selenomonas sputigena (strain ATCC 35185 / DSM 20758 / CCUG 44933 / VPI D19B-28) TaxID=546271 RepID=C9LWY9_SELS3|nr:hypothetical protein SELSPUOL_01996 [Selenomonas sputigena ATCC 35185]
MSKTISPLRTAHVYGKLHAQTSTSWTKVRRPYRNLANRSAPFGLDLLGFHGNIENENGLLKNVRKPPYMHWGGLSYLFIIADAIAAVNFAADFFERRFSEAGGTSWIYPAHASSSYA